MIVPTIGRIVLYTLAKHDVDNIENRRNRNNGYPGYSGNFVQEGDVFPAMIVRVWGNLPHSLVNLKVSLDGADDHWVTSREVSEKGEPGKYHWMSYQIGQAKKHDKVELEVSLDSAKLVTELKNVSNAFAEAAAKVATKGR